ncbi:MAG: hypothetical protein SWX82_18995 [Cyanobacteriota bacterium]|nr:hypothetical protein [Cyanobacteriota bacterium]
MQELPFTEKKSIVLIALAFSLAVKRLAQSEKTSETITAPTLVCEGYVTGSDLSHE